MTSIPTVTVAWHGIADHCAHMADFAITHLGFAERDEDEPAIAKWIDRFDRYEGASRSAVYAIRRTTQAYAYAGLAGR